MESMEEETTEGERAEEDTKEVDATEVEKTEFDSMQVEEQKEGPGIFKRILLYSAMVISVIFLLLGLAGIIGSTCAL